MRIDFECSGGYAGLRLSYHADTDKLPVELAQELLRLVESSGILDLQPSDFVPRSTGPPDVISYRLLLHEGDKSKSFSLNDVTVPATLRPLLGFLHKLALEQGRKG